LQNLVGNAIKFTPAGGVVSIAAHMSPPSGELPAIWVSVSDTGPGIPPEIQSRLFQKFVTGGQEESGSGLGLAFCKLAVEAHGQRIWIQEAARGATLTFSLPVAALGTGR
jgi:signal transduction histidine kinase